MKLKDIKRKIKNFKDKEKQLVDDKIIPYLIPDDTNMDAVIKKKLDYLLGRKK